ncbi:MAG: ABC transporter substrate-binding protein [Oscillochloridaceae bacterium]|nr:ABC transporter substrate-binding protein [Chloroflexaceae bacterium]MDW8391006.1 ABC transporter substrate-binding protein [Oscillochloridaceae bacterium]
MSRPPRWQRDALVDGMALGVLALYALLAWSAAGGPRGAPPLDPVWTAMQRRETLRVATDVGFRPFAFERDGEVIGYDIDLARAIAAELGVKVEFVPTGFDALYDSLVSGRADMIASALPYAPEQGFRARFSRFYFDAGQVLVAPAGAPIAGVADLSGQTVGVALGADADALARRLLRAGANFRLRQNYDDPADALADLRAGQLDAVITDMVTALEATQGRADLRIVGALTSEPLVLAFPRSAFRLEAEVNRILDDLQRDGFFARLNEHWFGIGGAPPP